MDEPFGAVSFFEKSSGNGVFDGDEDNRDESAVGSGLCAYREMYGASAATASAVLDLRGGRGAPPAS